MFQRDYLLIEIQKLSLILARLIGLKKAGKLDDFNLEVDALLQAEYDSDLEQILTLSEDEFSTFLQTTSFSAEKLNALAQILHIFAQPLSNDPIAVLLLRKVLLIFDHLAEKHQYSSYQNIEISNSIRKFLKSIGLTGSD